MNDRQLSRVDCANGNKRWWFCGTYLTCTEKFLHHIRLPKQGCFMEGAAFLCLHIKTGSIKPEILYTAEALEIIISTQYIGKQLRKEERGNTKGETFWIYAYHLVHFATNNYMVEKSKHFPAHRSTLMETNRMQCLKKNWLHILV